jgi:hypothetical protein
MKLSYGHRAKIYSLTFFYAFEFLSLVFVVLVDADDLGAREELHDHAGGDEWPNAQLHEGASVGGHDHSEPVEWVSVVGAEGTEDGYLRANDIEEDDDGSPYELIVEAYLRIDIYTSLSECLTSGTYLMTGLINCSFLAFSRKLI